MNTLFDVVIVANGEFPLNKTPLDILRNARHIVACDGAIGNVPQAEVVIGDGDSVPMAFHDRLIHIDEQEDNDLTKATRYCLSQGWQKIAYLGCTGKREYHTLGNISLLMRYYREMGVVGMMFTSYGFFMPSYGKQTFEAFKGQQVSILNFGCTKMESEGLKWESYAFKEWWQGTLNEAVGNSFTLNADGYYMVFQTYEGK
jgi:thiamine pyrophosphokinase